MAQAGIKLTINDWLAPEMGTRQELLDGVLIRQPELTPRQEQILNRLLERLREHVYASNLGDVLLHPGDVILTRHDLTQPDIVLLAPDGAARCGCEGVRGAPALVMELVTPANNDASAEYRRRLYGAQGVSEYWRVDPERRAIQSFTRQGSQLEADAPVEAGGKFVSALLPGFELPVAELFV